MRQSSPLSLRRIAYSAFADAPSLTMYSAATRPPFRGGRGRGRGRRSLSERPNAVSGDAHFQAVRESNSSFQRSGDFRPSNNFNNSNNFSQNYNTPSNSSGRGGSGGSFRGVPPPPFYGRRDQQSGPRVHRPKPADFRSWEFAKVPPPPHSERFVVLSYNILADYLAHSHRKLYFHIPHRFMSWEWRKGNILFELRLWSPDIMCFQEVDKFNDLEEELRLRGYNGIWKMRTGDPIDGCAIFWRTTRFRLVYEECIEFNKHGMRDNVAQVCVLESLILNQNGNQLESSTSSEAPNRVVICNIHVLFNPRRGEMKLGQVRLLLEKAHAVSKTWNDAPVVLCGDFNCTPMSPLYNFMSKQKLDVSEVDRDKVSGQASAVICPPFRQYGHQPSEQQAGDIASPAITQKNSIDIKQSSLLENEKDIESISEKLQGLLSQQLPPPVDSLGNEPENKIEKNTDIITDEIRSAKSVYHLYNETLEGPKSTSSLQLHEQESKGVPLSEDSIQMGNCDRLSSVMGSFDENVVGKETGDNKNSNMSHSDTSVWSSPESVEVSMLSAISEPNQITCEGIDPISTSASSHDTGEKFIELSPNEIDETLEDEKSGENVEETSSDLSNGDDAFPPSVGTVTPEVETVDAEMPFYSPSLWTPMEIATATGNANNPILEHPLELRSVYTEVVDSSRTRDSNGEPLVTSYNTCFMGTVDYIWRSKGLHTSKVLAPIPKDAMQHSGGFPTKKWGSDHIALASELAFTNKRNEC